MPYRTIAYESDAARKIVKRDGTVADFDMEKITNAIFGAAQEVGGHDRKIAGKLAEQVVKIVDERYRDKIPSVEDVQDIVEKVLIESGHARTAKAYILYREERRKIREKQKKILEGRITKLPFSLNALEVVAKRYLVRDVNGNIIETPEEMFFRVAKTLAEVEYNYGKSDEEVARLRDDFLDVMTKFEFTPAGRTVANAGAPTRLVSNCIVLNIEDSMDSIFQTLKEASLLQQAGSGLGFPFHMMRPAGFRTIKSRGEASGPVSFLQVYNKAFGVIKQQNRHGANMAVMRVDHPDILEFIHCKDREGDIKNFNISVGLIDEFMEKVRDNDPSPWMCEWKGRKMKPRRVYRDINGIVSDIKEETLTARELFMEIISSAWKTGEPGCVFLDRVNDTNPVPGLGRIEACNPCVTGDTLVSTENGLMKMEEIVDKFGDGGLKIITDNRLPVEVHHADGTSTLLYRKSKGTSLSEISAAFKSGIKPVWKLTTESGYELEATPDHKIMTTEGWIELGKLNQSINVLIRNSKNKDKLYDRVKTIEFIGEKEVYDLTEPLTHSFIGNSLVISNCGEQFLHDGDVCNLGSINLEKFVKIEGDRREIDFDRLRFVTRAAVRMLDNVIDLTDFPVEKVNKRFRDNRRIGLGIMGFADMLYQLYIPYNSKQGFETADKVMEFIQECSHEMSRELAEEKGVFPNWNISIFKDVARMRNAALTNIAPTGTIAMMFDVSGGVEPYFALAYYYKGILGGVAQLQYVNKHLERELKMRGIYSEELMDRICKRGSVKGMEEIPEDMQRVFVTAMDISAEDHIRMQAAFQAHIDNSISKTINFPQDASREDVLQGYLLAWGLGCKGCTVYRDKSRELQVLNVGEREESLEEEQGYVATESFPQELMVAKSVNGHIEARTGKLTRCPDCKIELDYVEGCLKCRECGFGLCEG